MEVRSTKEQFLDLRAKGFSYDKIAKSIGVSKPTLIEWSKELENELFNLKSIERERLQEMFLVSKKSRVKLLSRQLRRLLSESDSRDLSSISTSKLLQLILKYTIELKSEEEPIRFRKSEIVTPLDSLGVQSRLGEWGG